MYQGPNWYECPEVTPVILRLQASNFSSSTLISFIKEMEVSLEDLEPHQYYSPGIIITGEPNKKIYWEATLTVDGIGLGGSAGELKSQSEAATTYVSLNPVYVEKFGGLNAGAHEVTYIVNGETFQYTYTVTGERPLQRIGYDPALDDTAADERGISTIYILPEQRPCALFTAQTAGLYTFTSNTQQNKHNLYACLTDENGNILASRTEQDARNEREVQFTLSARLEAGQTVRLQVWFEKGSSEAGKSGYGVVQIMINDPSSEAGDLPTGTNRALLIGQTYKNNTHDIKPLESCATDVSVMSTTLSSLTGTPFTVTQKADLTKAEILSAITVAFSGAQEGDTSLFYYSGHGATGTGALVGIDNENLTPQ